MSAKQRTFEFKPRDFGLADSGKLSPLYSSTQVPETLTPSHLVLPPFAAIVTKVE
jgi:hypothetical protein